MNMKDFNQYYRKLVEDEWEQSQMTGKDALEYISHSTAQYHGRIINTLYMAKGYPQDVVTFLEKETAYIHGILTKVTKEYMEKEDYRKLFGFSEKLEKLVVQHPGYETLIPIARFDIFMNEEDYSYKFCEFNTDGTSAMNEDRELNIALKRTKGYEQIKKDYKLGNFELFDSWAEEVKNIYATYEYRKENPTIAIVDFLEKGSSMFEFEQFKHSFERAGFKSCICEIRDLFYDGKTLYSNEGEAIDIIYRRAVTSDIFEHLGDVKAFIDAVEDKNVCSIGNFCTQVAHDKTLFCVLHHERTKRFLTAEENEYIKNHVPFTVELNKEQVKQHDVLENKDAWLIKPKNSYGAKGVYAGINFSKSEWKEMIGNLCKESYILQEFIMPYQSDNIDFSMEQPTFRKYSNMTGLYTYNGKLAGLYSRMGKNELISGDYTENDVASIIINK